MSPFVSEVFGEFEDYKGNTMAFLLYDRGTLRVVRPYPQRKNGDAAWERQHEDSTEYFSLLCAAIVCLTVASEGRAVENTLNPNVDEGSMCYSCLPVSSSFSISSTLVFHFELVDKHHCMALRQFCNNLLQNCRVGRATVVQGSGVDTCPELASHAAKEWRRPLSGSH